LELVEWVIKNKKRSECVEFHRMGSNSQGTSLSVGQLARESSTETDKTGDKGEQ